ncbi:hypothetical protein BJY52DRAFT_1195193 [Lactarius psammicola]|nr:hypothetical protein BJY52DRAFT_1195193 [Lactarius psammicola]
MFMRTIFALSLAAFALAVPVAQPQGDLLGDLPVVGSLVDDPGSTGGLGDSAGGLGDLTGGLGGLGGVTSLLGLRDKPAPPVAPPPAPRSAPLAPF